MLTKKTAKATAGGIALTGRSFRAVENPKRMARIVLGTLLALNLIAAVLLLEPFGGSPEGLEATRAQLESQRNQQRVRLQQTKALANKMQTGGSEGSKFIDAYFLEQRSASAEILKSLGSIEERVGIRPRGKNFSTEEIEGSDEYVLLTIEATYQGTYGDLVEFVSSVDRSDRLLILDSLQVSPQQDDLTLQIQATLYGFVKQGGTMMAQAAAPAETEPGIPGAEVQP